MATSAVLAWLACAISLLACAPTSRPIVSEVYYDAPGDDTGWEFVELYNPLPHAVTLAGLKLEAGDGAAANRWTLRWTGSAKDSVRAGARFVIGGARMSPAPDAVVTLELQNGPDAMRIVWPDGASETLGWGALAWPEYYCGSPAVDVAAGQSLARVPDDADLGSNALDFRAAEPSPGRANRPDVDLALPRGSLTCSRDSPRPGEAMMLAVRVFDRGARAVTAGADTLALGGDALAESLRVALPAMASGETLLVTQAARAGAAGRRTLVARAIAAGDAESGNDADTLAVRVGDGPLEVTEIQFHPASGEGEWVEVRNRSQLPLVLSDFTFSDRNDARSRVVDSLALAPDSLALLVQDRAALLAFFAGLDPTRVATVGAWPALNNSNGADGIADVVTVRERDGLESDRVAYSATGVPAGTSLEKLNGAWRPSTTAAGTPLSLPHATVVGATGFDAQPRRLPLAKAETRLSWRLPWAQAHVSAALYDMEGRRIAQLFADAHSAASGERTVRLDGAGPGIYALVLNAHGEREAIVRTALVRIVGTRP